ncbi:MAG: zf-HC2 domain-containing protein [Candidatus Eisenbacteria sp.]|nr:zf-HC2 domain-containing protein [Candidatus Eisenbacteria bacterium]
MTHDQAQQALDDYVAEQLSAEQRRAFEAHLARCPECRRELTAQQDLHRRTAALAHGIAPPRDLWPGISARLTARPEDLAGAIRGRRRAWWRGRALWPSVAATALAAALLIVLVHSTAHRVARPASLPSNQRVGPVATTPMPELTAMDGSAAGDGTAAVIAALEAECRGVGQEYDRLLAEHEADRGNPILDLFAANLRIVNQAVDDARDAWQANPQSPQLVRILVAAYQAKATLQGRASKTLAQG